MKKHMLICIFISMLMSRGKNQLVIGMDVVIRGKECTSYKDGGSQEGNEVVIRKKMKQVDLEMRQLLLELSLEMSKEDGMIDNVFGIVKGGPDNRFQNITHILVF